jgi:hypothetical protein
MSKRLLVRLALAVAALAAMTLLQGCGENGNVEFEGAWAPVGTYQLPWLFPVLPAGTAPVNGGTTGGTASTASGTGG